MKLPQVKNIDLACVDFDKTISRREFIEKGAKLALVSVLPAVLLAKCGVSLLPDNHDSQKGILPSISFEIRFSKSMDKDSFVNGMQVSPAITDNTFYFEWLENDTVVYCKSYAAANTRYTVTLSGSIMDSTGLLLDGNSDGTGGDAYTFTVSA